MEKEQLISTVSAAQNGDNDALNTLFNEYYNDLYYFALKTVKDEETALDVTQEAFVEIINTISNLKEPAAFVTWAKQITYHQCTRYFKKKKDVLVDEDEDGNTVFDTLEEDNAEFIPDEALDKSDFKKTVLAILDELSEEQRSATMMYYFDEMSVRQIAEIQGVSEGTVKSRLNYARKAIKMSVEEYEKKNNIKLHALPFFPFFKWLFENSFKGGMPLNSAKIIAEGVGTATGTSITVATATTAAVTATAVTTTATAVGIGAKIAALPLVTKIIAGIVAVSIAVGGGTAAVILTNNDNKKAPADKQTVTSSDDNGNTDKEEKDENEELVLEGIIPEGCTYTLLDGTVLTAGQSFPEKCTAGDVVDYGDYLYGYECVYAKNSDNIDEWYLWKDHFDSGDSGLIESDAFESWSVMVKDQTKQTYGKIASKINGKPIKTLYATFFGCKNMTDAPKIPSTITAMTAAFYECTSLKAAPAIPKNVQRIMLAFRDCVALEGDVEINATLDKSLEWYYSDTFSGTKNKINLTGNTAEEDLILIAKSSDNKNITVNGKKVEKESIQETVSNNDDEIEFKQFEKSMVLYASSLSAVPDLEFSDAKDISAIDCATFLYKGGFLPSASSNDIETVNAVAKKLFGSQFVVKNFKGLSEGGLIVYNSATNTLDLIGNRGSTAEIIYKGGIKNSDGSYTANFNFADLKIDAGSPAQGTKGVDWEDISGQKYTVSKKIVLNVSLVDDCWQINSISHSLNYEIYYSFDLEWHQTIRLFKDGRISYTRMSYITVSEEDGKNPSGPKYDELKRDITAGMFKQYGVYSGEPVSALFINKKLKYTDSQNKVYITYSAESGDGGYGVYTQKSDGTGYSLVCNSGYIPFSDIYKSGETLYIIKDSKKYKLVPHTEGNKYAFGDEFIPGSDSDWII